MAVAVSFSRPAVHPDPFQPGLPDPVAVSVPGFLTQALESLHAINLSLLQLQEKLETLWKELTVFTAVDRPKGGKTKLESHPTIESLYSKIRSVIVTATTQLETLSSPSHQDDVRKQVKDIMDSVTTDIWFNIQQTWGKSSLQLLHHTVTILSTLLQDLLSLGERINHVIETIVHGIEEAKHPSEEAIEAEMTVTQLRPALLSLFDRLVSVVHSRYSEAEGWKTRKESMLIWQRIENLCRCYEEKGRFKLDPSLENVDELSVGSEEEEVESLVKHVQVSQDTVLGALKEQRQGLDGVGLAQASLQRNQDVLVSEISAIKGKLENLFPSPQKTPKASDSSKSLALLKAFAPDIRAINDEEFAVKLTKMVASERKEKEDLLCTVMEEGYAVDSLEDVAKEFAVLKSSYMSLRDTHEESILKSIKIQSELEAELAYQRTQIQQLTALHPPNDREILQLKAKIDEITIENVKLKVECSRMRKSKLDESLKQSVDESVQTNPPELTVNPGNIVKIPPKIRPFCKEKGTNCTVIESEEREIQTEEASMLTSDEEEELPASEVVQELQQRVQDRIDLLMTISDEEQTLENTLATLDENSENAWEIMQSLTSVHSRYDETFEEIQNIKDEIAREKQLQRAKMTLLPVSKQLLTELNARLDESFQVCGAVGYASQKWALVRQMQTLMWVRPEAVQQEMPGVECIEQYREACRMLSCSDLLPTLSRMLARIPS